MKLCQEVAICTRYLDIHRIEVAGFDKILTEEPTVVGGGGNSGFQAINIAIQFGVRQLLLVGFDMNSGSHWYGRNTWPGANNPCERNLIRWRRVLTDSADDIANRGIEVVNASGDSALVCFEQKTVEQALMDWGL